MTETIEKFPLPTDSAIRKEMPLCEGFLDYFPHACAYVSRISFNGNVKHNPGEKLHWARGKSMDQDDCIIRHTIERGTFDPDDGALHDGKRAWRALAALELELERRMAAGLPLWDEEIIAANRAKAAAARAAHPAGHDGRDLEPEHVGPPIKRSVGISSHRQTRITRSGAEAGENHAKDRTGH